MSWLQYLLQVNLYLLLFYGFYALVLRNETFFSLNRIYLVSGAILSFMIPLMQSEWIQSLFITHEIQRTTETFNTLILDPVTKGKYIGGNGISVLPILTVIYIAGAGVFLTRFAWQLIRIRYAFKSSLPGQAFSFFNRISIDPLMPFRKTIMEHEETHVRQWHSADVLFFELMAGINWFNPIVYFYKKAIRHIHEFIADEIAAEQENDKSEYALLLLSNTFGVQAQQLSNNFFNQSLLKRRIFMLSKTRSKKIAILKYGLSAPLFAMMLIVAAACETVNEVPEALKVMQVTEEKKSGFYTMSEVQEQPRFVGGAESWTNFMKGYKPELAKANNISGTVFVSFTVEKDGSLTDIKVVRDLAFGTGEEAVRLLKTSPKWIPGMQNGQPVRVAFTQPIKIAGAKSAGAASAQQATKTNWALDEIVAGQPSTPEQKVSQTSRIVSTGTPQMMPQFPGGSAGWAKFMEGYKKPELAKANNVSGTVFVQFAVEEDGSLTDIKVVRDINFGTAEEAIRLLKTSPKWTPAIQDGRKVRAELTQPIRIPAN